MFVNAARKMLGRTHSHSTHVLEAAAFQSSYRSELRFNLISPSSHQVIFLPQILNRRLNCSFVSGISFQCRHTGQRWLESYEILCP